MAKLRPLDGYILSAFKVPFLDARKIIKSMSSFVAKTDNKEIIENVPKFSCRRAKLAWSIVFVARENAIFFLAGVFCLFGVLPFFTMIHLFS